MKGNSFPQSSVDTRDLLRASYLSRLTDRLWEEVNIKIAWTMYHINHRRGVSDLRKKISGDLE